MPFEREEIDDLDEFLQETMDRVNELSLQGKRTIQ